METASITSTISKDIISINDSDTDLMLRFQKGDNGSFEELIRRYEKSVLNAVYRYTSDRIAAEDIAQEVFLRVFKSRHTYLPKSPFRHWLFSILTNFCLNYVRDSKLRQTVSLHKDEDNPQVNIKDEKAKTVSDNLKKMELKIAVRDALNSLQPKQRMVIILNKYEDASYEEIAAEMKMSVSAVKSLLFRARENLKEKLRTKI